MKRYIVFLTLIILNFLNQYSYAVSPYYEDSSVYDVKSYVIDLHMSHENTIISGFSKITAVSGQNNLSAIFLELNPELTVNKIIVNQHECTFHRNKRWLKVIFPQPLHNNEIFECTTYYSGEVSTTTSMGGFKSEYVSSAQRYITYSLSEPFASYLWFPCKQELTDKADSVFVNITTHEGNKVASNGLLRKVIPNALKKEVRYEWSSYYPTAYYLIAVALTDYEEYNYYIKSEMGRDSFYFQNYYYNYVGQTDQDTKNEIDETVKIIHLFERLLIPYPFKNEKYGHCLAPIGGGMENQTMTMVNSFSFGLIAHELAHSWFGNLVTCDTWKDIWVNEGLTSYFEYLSNEFLKPELAGTWMKDAFYQASSEPEGTLIIPNEEIENERRIFSYQLTYRKGAYFVHQLRLKINNDSLFFLLLRSYLKKYAFSNASIDDFKANAEEVSGMELDQLFDSWVNGRGVPICTVSWKYDKKNLILNLSQKGTSQNGPIYDVSYKLLLKFKNHRDSTIVVNQQLKEEMLKLPMPGEVEAIEIPMESSGLVYSLFEADVLNYYDVVLYPNPAYDTLYINFSNNERNRYIEIVGLNGIIFGRFSVKDKKNMINISNLPNGLYLIKISGSKKSENLKFVKRGIK